MRYSLSKFDSGAKRAAKILLLLLFLNSHTGLQAQISKGFWLAGGSFSARSSKANSSLFSGGYNERYLEFLPKASYFFAERFAAGARLSLRGSRQKSFNGTNYVVNKSTALGIGPQARYYFLKNRRSFNLLAEAGFTYYRISVKNSGYRLKPSSSYQYNFYAGPEFFFNPSVGLELLVGFQQSDGFNFDNAYTQVGMQVGLQFHFAGKKKSNK